MSETPKPPEGFELWADFAIETLLHKRHRDKARAELAALRAELAEYKRAVGEHNAKMDALPHIDGKPDSPEHAMRLVAEWFDARYEDAGTGRDEVQQDLRRFADEVATLRAERDRLRELLTDALPWSEQYQIAPTRSARVRKELAK